MNTTFERTANTTDEWYTPKEIIESLGEFDLDPCAPVVPLWSTAKNHFTKEDDGLSREWFGRVWLNPPYSRPLIERFVEKMADHNNGIALLFNRADGTQGGSPGCGSVLIAYGYENAFLLKNSGIEGKYVELK